MNYFAIEYNGNYKDHVVLVNDNGDLLFEDYISMTYDEMKSREDLEDFVIANMNAVDEVVFDDNDQMIITLIGEDDVFIWSIIMGTFEDQLRYNLVDWQKDGKKYRYEPLDK
jgi:hypothetical protein